MLFTLAAGMPEPVDGSAMPVDSHEESIDSASMGSDPAQASGWPSPQDSVPDTHPIELKTLKVKGKRPSKALRLRQSAEAVKVIETREAKTRTADMGEVLARNEGVGVRRGGGLGSGTRFSLAGLADEQIRFFLDGVPLEMAGYPSGIADIPVNLVEQVEIYRGVVPIRFGADALGGAVNLATAERGPMASASYQAGSFGTQRITFAGRRSPGPGGFFAHIDGFFDKAENDYSIDVEATDERGRLFPVTVPRFHDGYWAAGGGVELGLLGRPWAKRLSLRIFTSGHRKDIQHNVVMAVPYGEVDWGKRTTGATLRFDQDFGSGVSLDAVGGYTYGRLAFADTGSCIYDWFGDCVGTRRQPGEIESVPRDQIHWEHAGFARMNAAWRPDFRNTFRITLAPTSVTRRGDERRQSASATRDPLRAQRDLFTTIGGVEHELDLIGGRLENIAFAKGYLQLARSEEPLPGGVFRHRDRDTHRLGAGNSLRFHVSGGLYAKTSYEWATRLPRPDETFGDGVLILPNLELEPETSHNVNLGITLDSLPSALGQWRLDANGFLRETDRLIVLLGNDRYLIYQNVFGARSLGLEAAAGWTSPRGFLALDGNATWMEFRNTSNSGAFEDFEGDRIPNRPYFFANGSTRMQCLNLESGRHKLALTWNSRYVHGFFRGWESAGLRAFKQTVPSQLTHSTGLIWQANGSRGAFSATVEVQNLADGKAYDFFGVERPGRAFYFKTSTEI